MKYMFAAIHKINDMVLHCPFEFSSEEEAVNFAKSLYDEDYYKIKLIHIDGNRIVKVAPPERAKKDSKNKER